MRVQSLQFYKALKAQVLQSDYLQADESPIKVLDNTKPKTTHQGYMWVYRNPVSQLVLFDYRKGRSTEGPMELLDKFSGLLQCDGYKAYLSLAKKHPRIQLVSCLAHIRRMFFEAQSNHAELAEHALKRILRKRPKLSIFEAGRSSTMQGNTILLASASVR